MDGMVWCWVRLIEGWDYRIWEVWEKVMCIGKMDFY